MINCVSIILLTLITSCNYYYYQGQKLEEQQRYEEANIKYHRAYIRHPNNKKYQEAFQRTATFTIQDLLKRYYLYLDDKKMDAALQMIERARQLDPDNEEILKERKNWVKVLLAGKVDFQLNSFKYDIDLVDEMAIAIRFNTPNPNRPLTALINPQTGIFYVEDFLYKPSQDLLMFYSLNSIGIQFESSHTHQQMSGVKEFKALINLHTPVITKIQGSLEIKADNQRISSRKFYPYDLLKQSASEDSITSKHGIRYSIKLDQNQIKVMSSILKIDFVPQILYLNLKDQKIFVDFGEIVVAPDQNNTWTFQRKIKRQRDYYQILEKNFFFNLYLYYSEGAYPFIKDEQKE